MALESDEVGEIGLRLFHAIILRQDVRYAVILRCTIFARLDRVGLGYIATPPLPAGRSREEDGRTVDPGPRNRHILPCGVPALETLGDMTEQEWAWVALHVAACNYLYCDTYVPDSDSDITIGDI